METDWFDNNRQLWNSKTFVHKESAFYNLEGFRHTRDSLNAIEIEELGDVEGKHLLHLQCHFGMDSLSWAARGAHVTGVDFSDEAITLANELKEELSIEAEFVQSNLYDLPEALSREFDIVFTSYGTIGWLPDLERWASVIRRFLKPGGVFYMVDFHPVVWMFDEDFTHVKYPYHNAGVIAEESEGTYADRSAPIRHLSYGWNHSISEILNSLIHNGIEIRFFNEHTYSPYPCFNNVVKGSDGCYRIAGMEGKIPMLYSLMGSRSQ